MYKNHKPYDYMYKKYSYNMTKQVKTLATEYN